MAGRLIAFEGLDQSGKQTQAERLRDRLVEEGRSVRMLSFPVYDTSIGTEIHHALHGDRGYGPDVMQLLYITNRYEMKPRIEADLRAGAILICDRYVASSLAYGEAQGLDAAWLRDVQAHLPQPSLTLLLDIAPEVSAQRKAAGRDRYERDLELLRRVRESYLRQSASLGWVRLDAGRDREAVARDVWSAVARVLA